MRAPSPQIPTTSTTYHASPCVHLRGETLEVTDRASQLGLRVRGMWYAGRVRSGMLPVARPSRVGAGPVPVREWARRRCEGQVSRAVIGFAEPDSRARV